MTSTDARCALRMDGYRPNGEDQQEGKQKQDALEIDLQRLNSTNFYNTSACIREQNNRHGSFLFYDVLLFSKQEYNKLRDEIKISISPFEQLFLFSPQVTALEVDWKSFFSVHWALDGKMQMCSCLLGYSTKAFTCRRRHRKRRCSRHY